MKIKKNLQVRDVGGESIIMLQGAHGVDTTKIISLNETSLWLWNRFGGREFDPEQISDALAEGFGIDRARADRDARKWIDMMVRNNLTE